MKNILISLLYLISSVNISFAASQTDIKADKIVIGNKTATDKTIELNIGSGAANPKIKVNATTSKLQFSNDGSTFKDMGSGSGGSSGINLLDNGSFESGISSGWTSSGGTFSPVSSGSNLLYGLISASFVASAAAQYFESTAVTVPEILKNQDCMVRIYYKGADANGYLTVLDGSNVELVQSTQRAVLSSNSGLKQAKIYFTCPSSGSVKIRVQSTAAMAIGYFDEAHLGQADTALVSIATSDQIFSGITIGATTTAPTKGATSVDRFIFSRIANKAIVKLEYKQTGAGAGAGSGDYLFTLPNSMQFDPNFVSYYTSVIGAGADWPSNVAIGTATAHDGSFAGIGSVIPYDATRFRICVLYTNATTTSRGCVGSSNFGTTNASATYTADFTAAALSYSGFETTVSSKCPNDTSCENTFTAKVSSTGVVSDESLDFINGNCSIASGIQTCTFNSVFSSAPNCQINANNSGGGYSPNVHSISSTQVVFAIHVAGTGNIASNVILSCSKSGSDFKAKQNIIGYLNGSISTSGNGLARSTWVSFGGAGSAASPTTCTGTPCTIYKNEGIISSVTRSAAGAYTINITSGSFTDIGVVTATMLSTGGGINRQCYYTITSLTTVDIICRNTSSGTNEDGAVSVEIKGYR